MRILSLVVDSGLCGQPTRAVALSLCIVALSVMGASCAHGLTTEDRARARGHYEAAVALVHEGQKAAELGDGPGRDEKYREALRELLDGKKLDDQDPDLHFLLGQVYFLGFRRHGDALTHLALAIDLKAARAPADASDPEREFPEAEQALGVVLVDAKRVEEALPHFERARTNLLYQTPYFAEQELGWALFLLGRHDQALQHLQVALQAQPDLCGAYVKVADVEEARGNEAGVQKALSDFVGRCDTERLRASVGSALLAPAWYKLGQSRLRSGARDGAIEAFRTCRERFEGLPAGRECDKSLQALGDASSVGVDSVSSGG